VTKIRENDKRLKLTPLLFGHFRQVLNFTIFRQYFNNKKSGKEMAKTLED
jgi:hypothetical protein